ncbi:MAG: CBS domain-containing protein [Planctomycetota bacterium]|nr:CBS domain-containing protein [Planctomycetota bacterium]
MKPIRELIAKQEVHALPPEATVLDAARAMNEHGIGAILVLGADGELRGIFSERDVMARVVVPRKNAEEVRLEEVMTTELYTAGPEERSDAVAKEMQRRHIRHLPVVKDGQVIGILSMRDLVRSHLASKEEEVQALTAYIQGEDPEEAGE